MKTRVPKYLYHATNLEAWEKIKDEGLKPVFPAVYMTEDYKAAEWFASLNENPVIIKIKTRNLEKEKMGRNHELLCQILKTSDFYHYYDIIKPKELERVL